MNFANSKFYKWLMPYLYGFYGIKLKHLYKKNRMELGGQPYVGQRLNLIKKIKF